VNRIADHARLREARRRAHTLLDREVIFEQSACGHAETSRMKARCQLRGDRAGPPTTKTVPSTGSGTATISPRSRIRAAPRTAELDPFILRGLCRSAGGRCSGSTAPVLQRKCRALLGSRAVTAHSLDGRRRGSENARARIEQDRGRKSSLRGRQDFVVRRDRRHEKCVRGTAHRAHGSRVVASASARRCGSAGRRE